MEIPVRQPCRTSSSRSVVFRADGESTQSRGSTRYLVQTARAIGLTVALLGAGACGDRALTDPDPSGLLPSAPARQLSSTTVIGASYTITGLYNFGAMGNGLSVNSVGHVVGAIYGVLSSQQGYTDYLWLTVETEPTVVLACCGQANDVNDFDDVTGYQGPEQVYLWRQADGYHLLGFLPGQSKSESWGINNNGLIVGESGPNRNSSQAVLFLPSSPRSLTYSTINLGALTGLTYSIAWDVNDAGQIVGEGTDATGTKYALLWQPAPLGSTNYTVIILDPTSVGGAGATAEARRISSRGEIVGTLRTAGGESRAFVWSPTVQNATIGTMSDLGLGSGFGINNSGIAVGTGSDGQPFVWSSQSGRSALPSPGLGAIPYTINDAGMIAGWVTASNHQSYAHVWRTPNQPPVAAVGGPYAGYEAGAVAFSGAGSTDPNDDALSYSWDFGDGSTGTGVAPSHAYADNGTYDVTLTVTDAHGVASAPVSTTATIANVAPTITSLTLLTDPLPVGSTVALAGTFTDPSTLDTHTATVDWDDDAGAVGVVVDASARAVSSSRTFTEAGVYTVSLVVTDDDGGSATRVATSYLVVFDPSAGFVTGGGWITSLAGSYSANPSLSGKASFGFVSRYKNGATTPSGNTEFQFHVASFEFSSTSYQWLVVAGAKAQFKGTGTVNGAGNYGFMLSAVDGQENGGGGVDKFRIKIWDVATGDVVYDNQMASADDAEASTALGGGSIVIHK